jgi:hypothetical protein
MNEPRHGGDAETARKSLFGGAGASRVLLSRNVVVSCASTGEAWPGECLSFLHACGQQWLAAFHAADGSRSHPTPKRWASYEPYRLRSYAQLQHHVRRCRVLSTRRYFPGN